MPLPEGCEVYMTPIHEALDIGTMRMYTIRNDDYSAIVLEIFGDEASLDRAEALIRRFYWLLKFIVFLVNILVGGFVYISRRISEFLNNLFNRKRSFWF